MSPSPSSQPQPYSYYVLSSMPFVDPNHVLHKGRTRYSFAIMCNYVRNLPDLSLGFRFPGDKPMAGPAFADLAAWLATNPALTELK